MTSVKRCTCLSVPKECRRGSNDNTFSSQLEGVASNKVRVLGKICGEHLAVLISLEAARENERNMDEIKMWSLDCDNKQRRGRGDVQQRSGLEVLIVIQALQRGSELTRCSEMLHLGLTAA